MQALATSVELIRRGHEVSLLCLPQTRLSREADEAGVPTIGLLADDSGAIGTIRALGRLFKSYDYEVVHTHLSHDLWWIVPALKLAHSRARLFLTKHMASGVRKKDLFHRFLYGRLQGTFAISNYIAGSVLNTCPLSKSDVHVVPPGISPETFDPSRYDRSAARTALDIAGDVIAVGMVGRMTPGKGHEEFLRAAAVLKENSDLKFQFIVVGGASEGEDAYAASVHSLAHELGVDDVVRFLGFRKDVPHILAALDVLAFPSHEESFGLGLTEAMAMSLPVVSSGSAGVLDIVVDGETGILFPPKDHAALAAGISDLALDPDKRRRFGAAGRKRVIEFFSIESVVETLERYYSIPD